MAKSQPTSPSLWEEAGNVIPLAPLRRQVDKLFEDFSRGFSLPSLFGSVGSADFHPMAELHDGDKEAVLRIELPGVDRKAVQVTASDRTIEVTGEKKSETERKNGDRYTSERSFGSFFRSFTLPFVINSDKVDARFDKGVLTVKIPKPAGMQASGRKIEVRS